VYVFFLFIVQHTHTHTNTRTQDIVVFDEESDRHVVIPWEDAIAASFCKMDENTQNSQNGVYRLTVLKGHAALTNPRVLDWLRGDPALLAAAGDAANEAAIQAAPFATADTAMGGVPLGGGLILDAVEGPHPGGLTAGEWRGLANCWNMINKYGYRYDFGTAGGAAGVGNFPILDALAGGIADANAIPAWFRGKSMQEFMSIPEFRVYCVVARPFIEHVMQSAVMTVAGRDTGAMLFGPSGKRKCFRSVF
jgi:hypothetical protein